MFLRPIFHCSATRMPILRDVFGLGGGNDQDGNLAALLRLESDELALEFIDLPRAERGGQVGDPARQLRHCHLGPGRQCKQQQNETERSMSQKGTPTFYWLKPFKDRLHLSIQEK